MKWKATFRRIFVWPSALALIVGVCLTWIALNGQSWWASNFGIAMVLELLGAVILLWWVLFPHFVGRGILGIFRIEATATTVLLLKSISLIAGHGTNAADEQFLARVNDTLLTDGCWLALAGSSVGLVATFLFASGAKTNWSFSTGLIVVIGLGTALFYTFRDFYTLQTEEVSKTILLVIAAVIGYPLGLLAWIVSMALPPPSQEVREQMSEELSGWSNRNKTGKEIVEGYEFSQKYRKTPEGQRLLDRIKREYRDETGIQIANRIKNRNGP